MIKRSRITELEDDEPPVSTGSVLMAPIRWAVTLVLVGLIALAGVHGMAWTDGFRYLIAEQVGPELGLKVTFEKSRMDAGFGLILKGMVGTNESATCQARVAAEEIRVDWKLRQDGEWFHVVGMEVEKAVVRLHEESPEGAWLPLKLNGLGGWPATFDDEAVQDGLEDWLYATNQTGNLLWVPPRWLMDFHHLDLEWIRSDGEVWSHARDLSLKMKPIFSEGREMMHYVMESGVWDYPDGQVYDHMNLEWIDAGDTVHVIKEEVPLVRWTVPEAGDGIRGPIQRSTRKLRMAGGAEEVELIERPGRRETPAGVPDTLPDAGTLARPPTEEERRAAGEATAPPVDVENMTPEQLEAYSRSLISE